MNIRKWDRRELKAKYTSPKFALAVVAQNPRLAKRVNQQLYKTNASMLATIEHMEVEAGITVPGPIDLSHAWMEQERRRDPKLLPILGCVQWSASYPRDRHDPKRGCIAGSEDQDTATCDGCRGETREGMICLRCLPGGASRAIKRQASLKSMHTTDERKTSKVRTGKRFAARELVLSGSRDERE
jgi:hypothetical protein